jgi:hypothetical protein
VQYSNQSTPTVNIIISGSLHTIQTVQAEYEAEYRVCFGWNAANHTVSFQTGTEADYQYPITTDSN